MDLAPTESLKERTKEKPNMEWIFIVACLVGQRLGTERRYRRHLSVHRLPLSFVS